MKLRSDTKKQLELLLYKLLNDALLLCLVIFFAMLVLESVIPGYFFNPTRLNLLIIALFSLLGSIAFLGKRNAIRYAATSAARTQLNKSSWIPLVFALALIFNSVRNLSWLPLLIITATAAVIIFLFHDFFIRQEK